ncbi:GerAB/ArcD/ProY family transporter [Paenibacillus sedimenti]|uniref:GerAB/ArcD/ProY family transporter n=1 Tax=Paenibacillus sedimenti TaxID=2770274 RepID=UPI001CB72475|nr:endospore germination permease [Paenibacillus sedimenti]
MHNGLNMVEINTLVLGKTIGGFLSLVYIFYFIQLSSWITRSVGDFMHLTLMPKTPITMFHIMFLSLACYASLKEITAIVRVNEFIAPLIFIMFWVTYLALVSEWSWERFMPSFRLDLFNTMKETTDILAIPFMDTAICLTMIFPFMSTSKMKPVFSGILFTATFISLMIFIMIGVIGITRASHLTYPLFTVFQELRIYAFIEHVEAIVSIAVLYTVFFKLCVVYYNIVLGICTLFNIRNKTMISIPLIWVISGFALSNHTSLIDFREWDKKYMFIYTMLYAVIIPILLLIVTKLKRLKKAG